MEEKRVRVRILQTSACSSCKVAGHCSASESKEKIVDVAVADAHVYRVGEQVVVCTTRSAVSKALLIAFVLPFVVMVSVLMVVLLLTSDELVSALAALVSLVPYYLVVYLFDRRLASSVRFGIEKRNY